MNGTANCYQIEPLNAVYSFNCMVKGNSNESVGEVSTLEVLWETDSYMRKAELGTVISSVELSNDLAVFTLPNELDEGNALIAAKDKDGTILWSWHIWVTDTPVNHDYTKDNTRYVVQDRNLGAARGDHGSGDEWKESCGLVYEWGRKDPFAAGNFTNTSSSFSIGDYISNPTVIPSNWNNSGWDTVSKTMYDPCPVGYRVVTKEVYACLTASGEYSNGWNFLYDGVNTAWYPVKSKTYADGSISYWSDCYMWSSSSSSNCFYFGSGGGTSPSHGTGTKELAVRCMKDDPEKKGGSENYTVSDNYKW